METLYCTELQYIKCFSEVEEDGAVIRFIDNQIPNMYSHNLTFIKDDLSDHKFQRLIESEILRRKTEGNNFLNIQFNFPFRTSMLDNIKIKPSEITAFDYYVFSNDHQRLKGREDCIIKKLDHTMLDDALELDLSANGEELGSNFTKSRFHRRSKVYLEEGKVDNYLCYRDKSAIGHCDLFFHNNVAKIEDFDVSPNKQRQGFGTTILKEMITIAINNNMETIYLITENYNTAKGMYEKCGFSKVATKTEILFTLD